MTSLEFIEKEIKNTERRLQGLRTDRFAVFIYNREDEFLDLDSDIEYYENLLNHLLQIKAELEAWEVVKHTFNILPRYDYNDPEIYILSKDGEKEISQYVRRDEYDKINKALEVQND